MASMSLGWICSVIAGLSKRLRIVCFLCGSVTVTCVSRSRRTGMVKRALVPSSHIPRGLSSKSYVLPLCKCGCGEQVTHSRNLFLRGHNAILSWKESGMPSKRYVKRDICPRCNENDKRVGSGTCVPCARELQRERLRVLAMNGHDYAPRGTIPTGTNIDLIRPPTDNAHNPSWRPP